MTSGSGAGRAGGGLAPRVRWFALLCCGVLLALPISHADAAARRANRLSLTAPHHVAAGAAVVLRGRVAPSARGRLVLLQRREAHRWRTVQRSRTDARSRFTARVTAGRGPSTFRAVAAATRRAGRAVSLSHTVAGTSWQPCGSSPVKQDGTRWQCTFDDEFDARTGDARSLDPARWQTEVSTQNGYYTGAPETGVVCYTDDRDTVSVSAGALHLSVVPTGAQGSPCGAPATYRGGMVHSQGRFAQTYGRFEVRARLPQSTQPGLQETLWLYPEDPAYGAWPDSGEIDFAEFYSQYPDLDVPFVHYAYDETTTDPSTNTNVVTSHTCGVDPSAWNTYTVEWEPGRITILRNGRTCLVDDYRSLDALPPAAPFDRPFYVLLTQAVGVGSNAPTAATPFPATMDVDYVRAWK